MLFHALRSWYIDPGRPPAVDGGLRSQYPDRLVLGRRQPLDRPAAAAGWAKSINPLLRHEVEAVHRLGSRGYQTGPSEPRVDEHGRATCAKWLMSQDTSDEVTMCTPTSTRRRATGHATHHGEIETGVRVFQLPR